MARIVSAEILRDTTDYMAWPAVPEGTYVIGKVEADGSLSYVNPANGVEWMSYAGDWSLHSEEPFEVSDYYSGEFIG